MAGTKSNVVTYSFEGDTLSLEQAIKRIKDLLKSTAISLKKSQNGELTATQEHTRKQTKELLKVLEEKAKKRKALTAKEAKQVRVAGKQALSNVKKLQNAALSSRDKARAKEKRDAEREAKRQEKELKDAAKRRAAEEAYAKTPAGQERAAMQADALDRLASYTKDEAARTEIQSTTQAYREAVQAFQQGTLTQEELAEKTIKLNETYKNYAATLRSVKSLQEQNAKGVSFLGRVWGKFKSLALYRVIRNFIMQILQGIQDAFKALAKVNEPFDKAISELTSSFSYLINSVTAVVAPLMQILAPVLHKLADLVNLVSERFSKMFAAMAGNDTWVKANYQLKDYLDTLDSAKQVKGIDEINKLTTETATSEDAFTNVAFTEDDTLYNSLAAVGKAFDSLFNLFDNLFKSLEPILDLFMLFAVASTNITTALEPVFEIVSAIASVLAFSIGEAFKPLTELLTYVISLLASLFQILDPVFKLVNLIVGVLGVSLTAVLGFLVDTVLVNICKWLQYVIDHVEYLVPLIASLLALFISAKWESFLGSIVAIGKGFVGLATSIKTAITSTIQWIATQIKAIAINIKNAVSAWVAEKAYWRLGLAILAAFGVLGAAAFATVSMVIASANATFNSMEGQNPETYMANGGVVTAPTLAMVGEGKYDEAVIPLGQSPQFASMKEGIAEAVVSSIGRSGGSGSSSQPVVLNIDGKTLARALWPQLEKTYNQVGVKLK